MYLSFDVHLHIRKFLKILPLDPLTDVASLLFENYLNCLNVETSHCIHHHCTPTITAFTLALCGLPLWFLVSMEVSKFDQYHGYLSSVSLRLQKVYPNTWRLWFKRQMDLELTFSSVISLHTANSNKWTIFLTDLLALVLAYTV